MGVSLGKFSVCVGYRKAHVTCRDECLSELNTACLVRMVRLVRWGDDFSLSGRSLCNAFRDELGKHPMVKTTAVLGPNVEVGDVQEAIAILRFCGFGEAVDRGDLTIARVPGCETPTDSGTKHLAQREMHE